MARLIYSGEALDDLERLVGLFAEHDPRGAVDSARAITSAVQMLAAHPMVGRRVRGEIRELVVSYGRTGYVALYRFVPARDQVRILRVRHQRELDYP
jgi:plasmid stabilization system protein ParE